MSKIRQERTAEQIKQLLSEIFLREVSDPRLAGVTITDVEIDRELQYATTYVNALGDETRQEEVMAGLQSAAGFPVDVMGRIDIAGMDLLDRQSVV